MADKGGIGNPAQLRLGARRSRPREPETNENGLVSSLAPPDEAFTLAARSISRYNVLSAVAENQPANKNRMTTELSNFAARLREAILSEGMLRDAPFNQGSDEALPANSRIRDFDQLALELFALQFKHNAAYRKICEARRSHARSCRTLDANSRRADGGVQGTGIDLSGAGGTHRGFPFQRHDGTKTQPAFSQCGIAGGL